MEDTYKKRHFRGESAVNCTIAYRYFLKAVPVIQLVVFDIRDVTNEVLTKRQAQEGESYVIAQIGMAGAVNYHVTDLFCIRNGKIARIENYKGSSRR